MSGESEEASLHSVEQGTVVVLGYSAGLHVSSPIDALCSPIQQLSFLHRHPISLTHGSLHLTCTWL